MASQLNYTSTGIIHQAPYKNELKSFKNGRDSSTKHGGIQDIRKEFFSTKL